MWLPRLRESNGVFRCASPAVAALLLGGALLVAAPVQSASTRAAKSRDGSASEDLIRQSTFIFNGTVFKPNATTMAAVPASESTAIVRVDEVIDVPQGSPSLQSQLITVSLRETDWAKPGRSAVFFTKGWLLGNSLAVIEIGHQAGTETAAAQVRSQVGAVRARLWDEQLQQEIATSEAVVAGRVVGVRPAKLPHIVSEHDADWYEAEISVSSMEKGQLAGKSVALLFPHSEDVAWKNAPKLREGDEGVWLFHRNQVEYPNVEGQYTALKPMDFQSQQELPRILRLLRESTARHRAQGRKP